MFIWLHYFYFIIVNHFFVSLVYSSICPLFEGVSKGCVADIRNVCSWELQDLLPDLWQSPHGLAPLGVCGVIQDVVNREALVVWQLDHLDIIAFDPGPLALGEVPQVPDVHCLVARKVGLAV